jgi:hypothetical protein
MGQRRTDRRPGKPSLLQPDVERALVQATYAGAPVAIAAQHAGISERAFMKWMERGFLEHSARDDGNPPNAGEQPFLDLYEKIVKARADTAVRSLTQIHRSAQGGAVVEERTETMPDGSIVRTVRRTPPDWRASAWYLERQLRADYGKEVAVTGGDGGPIRVEHTVDVDSLATRIHDALQRPTLQAIAAGVQITVDAEDDD